MKKQRVQGYTRVYFSSKKAFEDFLADLNRGTTPEELFYYNDIADIEHCDVGDKYDLRDDIAKLCCEGAHLAGDEVEDFFVYLDLIQECNEDYSPIYNPNIYSDCLYDMRALIAIVQTNVTKDEMPQVLTTYNSLAWEL